MSDFEILATQITLVPAGEPIFSEHGWTITIDDEAAGEFIVVNSHATNSEVRIDSHEWPQLRDAIDSMIARCRA